MKIDQAALEAIAREVRRLTLGYAALHFDGMGRMCNPAYVSEYLRGLNDAPIDVSGLAATFAVPRDQKAPVAAPESALAESILAWWDDVARDYDGEAPAFVNLAMGLQSVPFEVGEGGE